jgi:hypothetical protein
MYATLVRPCVPRAPPISALFLRKLKSDCSFTELFKILRQLIIDTPIWNNRLFTLSWYCQHHPYEYWYSFTVFLQTFLSYITENTTLFHKSIGLNHGFASTFAGAVKPLFWQRGRQAYRQTAEESRLTFCRNQQSAPLSILLIERQQRWQNEARLTLLSYRSWKFPWFSSAARRTPGYRNKTGHGPFPAPASNRDLVKLDSFQVAKKPSTDAVLVLLIQSPASHRNKFLHIIPHIPAMCSWSINMTTWRLSAKRKIR